MPREQPNPSVKLGVVIGVLILVALAIGALTSVADLPIIVGVLGVAAAVAIALLIVLPMLAARTRR
jgi:heme A synthase